LPSVQRRQEEESSSEIKSGSFKDQGNQNRFDFISPLLSALFLGFGD